jgi:hypothetical protein
VPAGGLAKSPAEPARLAEELGEPIVMKVASAEILHKSDVGGVDVDARPAEAASVYERLAANARLNAPSAVPDGVLVERRSPGGVEMIVGVLGDDVFGPQVVVGAGGLYAEVLADTVVLPLPVDHEEAQAAVRRLRSGSLLLGARGAEPADVEALTDIIVRVAALAGEGEIAAKTRPQSGGRRSAGVRGDGARRHAATRHHGRPPRWRQVSLSRPRLLKPTAPVIGPFRYSPSTSCTTTTNHRIAL